MSILACFILSLIPHAASITFNFTNITPTNSHDIVFARDAAYTLNDGIQVTSTMSSEIDTEWLVGRATYIKPLHLWDNYGYLASFSTSFETVINDSYADGFTFFLAQNNSVITSGGSMGLPFNTTTNTSIYPFVAVEFDTFGGNEWDPKHPDANMSTSDHVHVGISINSLTSVESRKWDSNMAYGKACRVLIEYSSKSKVLSASFTSFKGNLLEWETRLNYTIDLRDVLPEWVIFGFSASAEDRNEQNIVISWTFNSTEFDAEKTKGFNAKENKGLAPALSPENTDQSISLPPGSNPNAVKGENNTWHKVVFIAGPLFVVCVLATPACCLLRRKKNDGQKGEELGLALETNNEFEMEPSMPRRFPYHELARSTSDFEEKEKLGEGGFGGVYKGFLKELNTYVAVKRVSKSSKQGIKEYASEVMIISRLRHRNLVQLIGWCHEKRELLLAYEFMENGSLDSHLFYGKSLLTWKTRYKIAHDLASALQYLHEEWEQCVLHRDIKSSNVMLDSNFTAKLGDFGLAKLIDHDKGAQTTILAGTLGYMAPECAVTGRATKDSDVFSFGVVALEIACGRKVIDYKANEDQMRLLERVWKLYGTGTLLEAVDPSLGSDFVEEEIERLMIIGLWCVHPDPDLRPKIRQVIKLLNSEDSLPALPSKMPVASYLGHPISSLSDFSSISQYESSSSISLC